MVVWFVYCTHAVRPKCRPSGIPSVSLVLFRVPYASRPLVTNNFFSPAVRSQQRTGQDQGWVSQFSASTKLFDDLLFTLVLHFATRGWNTWRTSVCLPPQWTSQRYGKLSLGCRAPFMRDCEFAGLEARLWRAQDLFYHTHRQVSRSPAGPRYHTGNLVHHLALVDLGAA